MMRDASASGIDGGVLEQIPGGTAKSIKEKEIRHGARGAVDRTSREIPMPAKFEACKPVLFHADSHSN